MCFQEQAMEVVKRLAGFTGGEADNFRKIMSKLYRLPGDQAQQVMQKDHDKFIHGCMTLSGLREQDAESIWTDNMLPLGNYLFNKPHSSSYGLQAYQDMHIKIHYPLAFYAADLTVTKKPKKDETIDYYKRVMREATIFNVTIAQPDVNESDTHGRSAPSTSARSATGSPRSPAWALLPPMMSSPIAPTARSRTSSTACPAASVPTPCIRSPRPARSTASSSAGTSCSRTRKWPEHKTRLAIVMTCGCKKGRSVGVLPEEFESDPNSLDGAIDQALTEIVCKRHAELRDQELGGA